MIENVLLRTEFPGMILFSRGKVRDTWIIPVEYLIKDEEFLLMITTDRISAFDVVMSRGVPELGRIRNQISLFWFEKLKSVFPNHIFGSDESLCLEIAGEECYENNHLAGRCSVVYKAKVVPVECVVRGYITGSAWESYQKTGQICGIKLPSGLKESEQLPIPIFTPATKAGSGHDENISFKTMIEIVGESTAVLLREKSLQLYDEGAKWAREHGFILADTKFEFGLHHGKIILVDELLTPDSSRFWEMETYEPGRTQPSFDKQSLRDWLKKSGWDKNPPPPSLPDEVIEDMLRRYITAYERLTEKSWSSD